MADKRTKLTAQDLYAAIETNQGFGYLVHSVRTAEFWRQNGQAAHKKAPFNCVIMLDNAVVYAANNMGWSAEQLQAWANSKDGRHFADSVRPQSEGVLIYAAYQAEQFMRKYPA